MKIIIHAIEQLIFKILKIKIKDIEQTTNTKKILFRFLFLTIICLLLS
jgi:hypothetical protein